MQTATRSGRVYGLQQNVAPIPSSQIGEVNPRSPNPLIPNCHGCVDGEKLNLAWKPILVPNGDWKPELLEQKRVGEHAQRMTDERSSLTNECQTLEGVDHSRNR